MMRRSPACPLQLFESLIATLLLAAPAWAQLPAARLYNVFPPGAQQGQTLEVTIGGEDLEDAHSLVFTSEGITAVQKTQPPGLGQDGPQPVPGAFTVTVSPDVPAGLYEVRAVGKYGVSNPRAFLVDSRAEVVEQEPNNAAEIATEITLGSIINGRSNGANDQDYFKFSAKAGQRIIADCWAYRIDSRMDPSLILFDANGKELERSRDAIRRDPLIDFTVPADGVYYLEVHDFLYTGGNDHVYRLTVGTDAHLDFVFPPAGLPGSTGTYTLYGRNLPGGKPTDLVAHDGKPLEALDVEITLPAGADAELLNFHSVVEPEESAIDGFAYRLSTPTGLSNDVLIGYATAPIVPAATDNTEPAKAQVLTPACEVVGQFRRGQDQYFTFEAKAGTTYWIEVTSQRLGLPTDPMLAIQQVTKDAEGVEQVKELAAVDDFLDNPEGQTRRGMAIYEMKTDDPATRFVAPADGTYRIHLQNLARYTKDDPRRVYRLAIRPEQPDFRVVAKPRLLPFNNVVQQNPVTVWTPYLRKGGTEAIDVVVFRRDGFAGAVEVSVAGLPAGVTAAPITVGPDQNLGELVLHAAEDAPAGMSQIKIVARAKIGDKEVVHPARYASLVWGGRVDLETPRMRLIRDLAVAVSGTETAPFLVDSGSAVLEMCKAGTVQVPVKLVRRGEFKGAVTLTPFPLPPGVKPPSLTLDDKTTEGKLDLALGPRTPSGIYSLMLKATAPVSYSRNPEAVAQAQARKAAVDKIVTEQAAAAKAAAEASAAADGKVTEANAALEQSKAAAAAAAEELAAAQAKMKAASEALAAAEAAATVAAEAKAAAAKAAADADAQAKAAAEAQKAVDKQLADATAAAKPKDVNVTIPSTVVTIKVTDAPVTLEVATPPAAKPATTLEVPFKVNRLYGFAAEVNVTAKPQNGSKLKIDAVTLPADQSEGKLAVEVPAGMAAGTHQVTVQATAKFNGQDLSASTTVPVVIEPADNAQASK